MKLRFAQIGAAAALTAACGAALAYMLPGDFIVGKVADLRSFQGFSELTAEGAVTLMTPAGVVSGEGRLHYKSDCCMELRVVSGSSEHKLSITDGKLASATPSLSALRDAITGREIALLDSLPGRISSSRIFEVLRLLGIDYSTRSLSRFHGRVAYVLGAGSKDRESAQFWVDKDSFQVLRAITGAKQGGKTLDVKLTDYQVSPLPGRFPRNIEIYSAQQLLFRMEADKVYAGLPPEEDEDKAAPQPQQTKPGSPARQPQQTRQKGM